MKAEAWIFGICTIFFVLVTPSYWFITGDHTGFTALIMTSLLTALITYYLAFHAKRMTQLRPEDRKDAEIADGAGELGFFPPYSWWPLWCGACLATMALGAAVGWWLFVIGAVLGAVALCGLVFEYYRGEHAH